MPQRALYTEYLAQRLQGNNSHGSAQKLEPVRPASKLQIDKNKADQLRTYKSSYISQAERLEKQKLFYQLLIGRTKNRKIHSRNKSHSEATELPRKQNSFTLFSNPRISQMMQKKIKEEQKDTKSKDKPSLATKMTRIRKIQVNRTKSQQKNGQMKLDVQSLGIKVNTPYSKYISFFSTYDPFK